MGVSAIDGTLETATIKRQRRSMVAYSTLVFRQDDGQEKTLKNILAMPAIAAQLQPGKHGRFYLYKAVDHQGMHGVRADDGTEVQAYPLNNEIIMALVAGINLVIVFIYLAVYGGIPILATVLSIFGSVFFFVYRATRMTARQQWEADTGFHPRARPTLATA